MLREKIVKNENGEMYVLGLNINEAGRYSKKYFKNFIKVEFENHFFPAPQNFDGVLKELYGEYMKLPAKKDRVPAHQHKITFLR